MEILILELIWWAILFFFFWALRDASGRAQEDVDALALLNRQEDALRQRIRFRRPEGMRDPIGRYMDQPIYRYVELNGRIYQFDRACPPDLAHTVDPDDLYVAPGLVYQECARRTQRALQA
jgi:hypothetical protein